MQDEEDIYGYCSYCKSPIKKTSILVQLCNDIYHKYCFDQLFFYEEDDE